jgi:hypothetical protein
MFWENFLDIDGIERLLQPSGVGQNWFQCMKDISSKKMYYLDIRGGCTSSKVLIFEASYSRKLIKHFILHIQE